MSDDTLPPEVLLNILIYLPARDLIKCREVSAKWRSIIDGMALNDDLWARHCKQDFGNTYEEARRKAKPGLIRFHLYRSLTLWRRLSLSSEDIDEFSFASSIDEEIRNFEILDNGILGVLKKSGIVYYNADTLKRSERGVITGDYSRYTENDRVIIILNYLLHCFLIRKALFDKSKEESNVTFDKVKLYTVTNDTLYFVNVDDEIYECSFDDKKLRAVFVMQANTGVMSIGVSDGNLNILTFERDIYSIENKELVFRCTLDENFNFLHQIHKYKLLEQLDWKVYFQWMCFFKHRVPNGPLKDIIIIRSYGDIFFVGCNSGVLRIYYAPYCNGELDIFNTPPLKQFNFMERSDCPIPSMCPILQVDIMEVEDGHRVLVAMPKKIAVLNFTHNFKQTASTSLLSSEDIQKVKSMKI